MADVAYYERQDDGGLRGYDSDGNLVMTTAGGGYDTGDRPVYGVHTDPVTGETYRSREGGDGGGVGPRGGRRSRRRAGRQTGRKQEEAERKSRTDFFGRRSAEGTGGIDDPWLDLQAQHRDDPLRTDRASLAAQQAALAQLEHLSRGGTTAQEQAAMQRARMQTAQQERAQRQAIIQQAALRGMQGAGTTVGAQLQAQQAGANRMSQAQLDTQAMAQQRALQALQSRGTMATQMRSQADDFNQWNRGYGASVAQGLSGARATQGEQNRAMMENAQQQQTTTEKRFGQTQGLIGSI